ncbi:MAG: glycosyltransferase family 4 protein [Sphaerochaeta sp.]|uniref:glycosyltransferase family 4 protein n=1 Tax=Sphaerochaeta sp. TaxID=1972642 RepID=UPI003D0ECCA3
MKNLWIFHHYATLPSLNGHIRPYNFARHLADTGISTTIFAASYQHFSDINIIQDDSKYLVNNEFDTPFVFVKTPSSKSGGVSRVKNMLAFYRNLFSVSKQYAKEHGKPDVILSSSPQPLAMIAGIKIAKHYRVPCICEVRDLWPEAIFLATRIQGNSLIGKFLTAGEHWIYRHGDALIFTKEGDTDYLKEHKWTTDQGGDIDLNKCYYINNGVELSSYYEQIKTCKLDDADLNNNKFRVVYTGAIRKINNVGNIIDTAYILRSNPDIEFLIYGDGNEAESLRRRIVDEKLMNVKMKGFIEKKYIPFILSRSSVNLLNYSQTEYNWTRGNSSNKLFEYMASGRPVISTVKMGYSIIDKYNCGIELDEHTPEALADAILQIKEMPPAQYERLCENTKDGAKDFDYKELSKKLLSVIMQSIAIKGSRS